MESPRAENQDEKFQALKNKLAEDFMGPDGQPAIDEKTLDFFANLEAIRKEILEKREEKQERWKKIN